MLSATVPSSDSNDVVAIDLFCGAGGLAYGLRQAGLRIAAGIDLDPNCKVPIEENCGAVFVQRDVEQVTSTELRTLFGAARIRVMAGCAPCQPFSTYAQSRKSPDRRWELLKSFQKLVVQVLPEIVTMENVAGLATRDVWHEFVAALELAGYDVKWKVVSCTDYGVPQQRKRLVLIGSRLGPISLPVGDGGSGAATVADAIRELPPLSAGGRDPDDPLHTASRLSSLNLERVKASKPGGTWRDWPLDLRSPCHRKKSGETYPAVYGRMEWGKPAPTITTQCYGFGNGRFGHPEQNRAISLREAALLQSFPRKYKFTRSADDLTFRHMGTLIGNAVPPKLGEAIGRAIINHVQNLSQ